MESRHRQALACALIVFATWQLGLDIAVNQWLPEVRDPFYGNRFKRLCAWRQHEPAKPLLVMLGTSHVQHAFCPSRLEESRTRPLCFNFGLPSAGPLNQLVYLRRLIQTGVRPNWVVMELSQGTWFPGIGWDQTPLAVPEGLDWHELTSLRSYFYDVKAVEASWLRAQLFPAYGYRSQMLMPHAPGWVQGERRYHLLNCTQANDDGWHAPSENASPERVRQALDLTRREYAQFFNACHTALIQDRAIREMIDLCRQHTITPILIMMPEGDHFREWCSPSTKATVAEYVAKLEREENVRIIDARRWLPESAFYDSHHTNRDGAIEFTRRLDAEVLQRLMTGDTLSPGIQLVKFLKVAGPGATAKAPSKSR